MPHCAHRDIPLSLGRVSSEDMKAARLQELKAMSPLGLIAFAFILLLAACAPQAPVEVAKQALIEAISEYEKMIMDADFEYQFSEIQVLDNEMLELTQNEMVDAIQEVRCISFRYISRYADDEEWIYQIAITKNWLEANGNWSSNLLGGIDNDLAMAEAYEETWGECLVLPDA